MSISLPHSLATTDAAERARAKESLWRLTSLALAHPAREYYDALASGAFQNAFSAAWQQVTGRIWHCRGPSCDFAAFESGFIAVFLHGPKGKPLASLFAGEHQVVLRGLSRPVLMLNLTSFYRHFGLRAAQQDEGRQDEPDHLSAMCEFMAVLCHLEAGALAAERDPGAVRRAQRDFLCRFLKPFLGVINDQLCRCKPDDLDPVIAQLCVDMANWAESQVAGLEAMVGAFRDPATPVSVAPAGQQIPGAETVCEAQNLWN